MIVRCDSCGSAGRVGGGNASDGAMGWMALGDPGGRATDVRITELVEPGDCI